jgi:hypothetical protein
MGPPRPNGDFSVFGLVRRIPAATGLVGPVAHGPYRGGLPCGEASLVYSMRLHQVPNSHSCDFDEQAPKDATTCNQPRSKPGRVSATLQSRAHAIALPSPQLSFL